MRYPGEGPLTTLDTPDAPGVCLTPTQEIMTCDMIRRKTMPVFDMRGVWEHPYALIQWTQVQEMPCMGMQCGMCKGCCGFAMLSGVASFESQSQSCSQGLGSRAAEGTLGLTQGKEQAMDVRMADVQMAVVQGDPQSLSERVA